MTGCLFLGDATAQGLRQPFSVRPTGFDYNRYWQDDTASPSDQVEETAPEVPEEAPAETAAAPAAPVAPVTGCAGGCTSSCDVMCDSCAGGPCSGGHGCGLGLLGDCCLGDPWTISSHLFCEDSPWSAGGWSQWGYHNKSTGLFNSHPGKLHAQQQWVYLEKATDTSERGWDWGFRTDFMYGIDAADTQAFGNPVDANGNPRGWDTGWNYGIYGWALPQLYATLAVNDLSVKVGHFYTLIGYEVVQAPDNFFYSHAFTMYNNEPFTHTGALASYNVNENVTVHGGWTAGWDTGFDQFGDGSTFLGGISAQVTDDASLAYMVVYGDSGWRGGDAYMHSVVADLSLTEKLNYVFQWDLLEVEDTAENSYAINQYLFYSINDCLKLGGRFEWWKADPLVQGLGNASVYEATAGVNLIPHANFRVRPEIRHQWSPAADYDETIFGIDVIGTF
jgi:hypothetical protein